MLKPRFGDRWRNLRKDVEEYVSSCTVCQSVKFKFRPKPDLLTVPPHASSAFHTIHLDYGELQMKSERVKATKSFILLVDEYSRFVETTSHQTDSTWTSLLPQRSPLPVTHQEDNLRQWPIIRVKRVYFLVH